MKKPAEAITGTKAISTGKVPLRRNRQTSLKPVEEAFIDGAWRTRTEDDVAGDEPVRFKVTGLYVAGKRVRRFFGTMAEAETFIDQQTTREGNLGARAKHVDGRLVEDAVECEALLKKQGVRLLDAVRDFLEARELLKDFPEVSLATAARHYGVLLADRARSWTVDEAATAWLVSRMQNRCSDRYLHDARNRLGRFRQNHGTSNLADIGTRDVETWVNGLGLGPQSVCNFLTVLGSMFSYAVEQERCPRNPVRSVRRPKVERDEPGILLPDELRRLLNHLPDDAVPYVVLSAFAGLRPQEVRRLTWEDINFKTGIITVKTGTSKTKRRRTVPMTENLKAWLRPLAKNEGPVVTIADLTMRKNRINPAKVKAKLNHWPHDCLRHSAASYWLEKEGDDARVALWLGHDRELLHEHYKGLLRDPADAAEWFAIMPLPERAVAKIISINAA